MTFLTPNFIKTVSKGLVASLLVLMLLVAPISHRIVPQEAHAAASGSAVTVVADKSVTGTKNLVENTATAISSGVSAFGITSLNFKETVLDGLFNTAAKIFLRSIVNSIITWINSGFKGAPAFVTDLEGFLLDVADATIGEFIYNDPSLNFLCSPFQLDVKIALAVQYSESRPGNYEPKCTLSGVADNVEGFLEGSFDDGGWPAWFELTQNPENTPMGAYLSAETEAYARIIDAEGNEIKKLDFGDGFFSIEICDVAEKASGAKPDCDIGTPGSVIANQINKALGAGQDELIAADEINEIFNALFAQLAKQAITGIYGLLGLGGNSSYSDYSFGSTGSSTFLDAITEEDEVIAASSTTELDSNSPIMQSLEAEEEYLELQYEIIGRVDSAENDYRNASDALDEQACSIGFSFPNELETARLDAVAEVTDTLATITILDDIIARYNAADEIDTQVDIIVEYEELEQQDTFRTLTDNVATELFIEYDLEIIITEMEEDIDEAFEDCSS